MVNNVPSNWVHSAFSIGKNQMSFVAAAVLSGGNVRIGLEDNLWLERGRLASNAELVEKASGIITAMGVEIMTPEEVRAELNLVKRDPLMLDHFFIFSDAIFPVLFIHRFVPLLVQIFDLF